MDVDDQVRPLAGPSSGLVNGRPATGYLANAGTTQGSCVSYNVNAHEVFKKPIMPSSAILRDDELSYIQDMLSPPGQSSTSTTSASNSFVSFPSPTQTIRKLLNHIQATQALSKPDRKGKGRAVESSLPTAPTELKMESMFEQAELAKLQVENSMLRRQAAVLARRSTGGVFSRSSREVSMAAEQGLQRSVRALQADKQYLLGRLREAETRKRRFELELRYLRSFLLERVQPVHRDTARHRAEDEEDEEVAGATPNVRGDYNAPVEEDEDVGMQTDEAVEGDADGDVDINDAATLVLDNSQGSKGPRSPSDPAESALRTSLGPVEQGVHSRGTKRKRSKLDEGSVDTYRQRPRLSSKLRRATMGDAEVEHLLLASTRLTRLARFIDYHPDSHLSLFPGSQQEQSIRALEQASFLPPPAQAAEQYTASHPAARALLASPIQEVPRMPVTRRRASSTAGAQPRYKERSLSVSSPGSEEEPEHDEFREVSNGNDYERESASPVPASAFNNPRKIGRPRGSPNKTKTVSINETQAVRRRAKAQEFAEQNGGQSRGRGRPSENPGGVVGESDMVDGSASPMRPSGRRRLSMGGATPLQAGTGYNAESAQAVFGSGGNGNVADLLQAARKLDYTKPSSQAPSNSMISTARGDQAGGETGYEGAGGDEDDYYYEDEVEEGEDAVEAIVTATSGKLPANRHQSTSQLSGDIGEVTSVPRQASALDLLADQAAASLGPPAIHADNAAQDSSRQQQQTPHYDFSILGGLPDRIASTSTNGGNIDWLAAMVQQPSTSIQSQLAPAFTQYPNQSIQHARSGSSSATSTGEWKTFTGNLPPMTIAEQLRQGVDATHHLIDPRDLKKGMTPAAALAKKARSPYVKWSAEEDEMLIVSVSENGTRWDVVASKLANRSYHQCRQRWLRGLKSGDGLPEKMRYLKPKIDSAIAAHETTKSSRKSNARSGADGSDYEE